MDKIMDYITKDLARRIYNDLQEGDSGSIPYRDTDVYYYVENRAENQAPRNVKIEVKDEEGYNVRIYHLHYGSGFDDYTIED